MTEIQWAHYPYVAELEHAKTWFAIQKKLLPAPKTNGPPMLRIPLASKAQFERRERQLAKIAELEKDLKTRQDKLRWQQMMQLAPRSDDCTRLCDYKTVCRISQVRHVGKTWPEIPRLESAR